MAHVQQGHGGAGRGCHGGGEVDGLVFALLRGQGTARGQQTAMMDAARLSAPAGHLFGAVAAHDDGAVFAHAVQHIVEAAAVVLVQTVRAFVQQQQGGPPHQGAAQQEQAELPL